MKRIILLILGLSLLISVEALACKCKRASIEEHYNQAEIVFSGRVQRVVNDVEYENGRTRQFRIITIEIIDRFKGISEKQKDIKIKTNSEESSCGAYFMKNKLYVVFSSKLNEEYWTTSCSGTKKLTDIPKPDLEWLEQNKAN